MRTSGKILAFLAIAAFANAVLANPARAQSQAELEARYRGEISGDPASLAAHLGLAEAVAAQGRTGEAVARLLDIGRHWIDVGAYEQAVAVLEAAAELQPDSRQILAELGQARIFNRQYIAAEPVLERAVALGDVSQRTLFYLGSALWENGDYERSEKIFRQALRPGSRPVQVLTQLGRLLLWQGRYEEAVALLRESVAAAPTYAEAQLDLARSLQGLGDADATLAAYRRAVELLPEHYEARYGLAMSLQRSGDVETARREFEVYQSLLERDQRRTLEKDLEKARIDYGRDLLQRGEVEAAVEYLAELPASPDVLAALARALKSAGRNDEAVQALSQAVAMAPDRTDLRTQLNEARLDEAGS